MSSQYPTPTDRFSQELLRRFVPSRTDGQPVTEADRRAHRDAAIASLPHRAPSGPAEVLLAEHLAATHIATMECFRRSMLADISDRTRARLRSRAAALLRASTEAGRLSRQPPRLPAKRKNDPVLPHVR